MKKIKTDNVVKFPTSISDGEKEIEAILFASSEPLDEENIETKISKKINVKKALENLKKHYENRGINLICISNKWSFRTSEKLSYLMSKQKTVEKKLSKAAIETLSIIVYHQPVTRAEIEEIRGVAFGTNTLEILMELNWVKPGGRKDVPVFLPCATPWKPGLCLPQPSSCHRCSSTTRLCLPASIVFLLLTTIWHHG